MSKPFFFAASGAIFFLLAVIHGFRAVYGFDMTYDGWVIPIWASWIATLMGFILSYHAIKNIH